MLTMQFRPLIESDEPAVSPEKLPQCIIAVAQDSLELSKTLEHLRWLLISLCGGAMFLSGIALVVVTNRAIRPVKDLARQIEALRETDLAATLSAEDFPGELAPVVERLNGLLARLAIAFTRERAFTADIAHEMRTPLAGLRATLQVAGSRPRAAAAYESAIHKSLAILDQMQNLVEKLLLLARADSGQLACCPSPTDLSLLLQECIATHQDSASVRGLHFSLTENAVPDLLVDRELLRIALANLIDNAVSYAQPNTAIILSLNLQESAAQFEITNTGHCLTEADLPNLLKRFVRKDASRSATGVHAGLGLSICQRLLALQSATLTLLLDADKFIARVRLPLAG
jgi:two-component system sensor histidine kinase QseC